MKHVILIFMFLLTACGAGGGGETALQSVDDSIPLVPDEGSVPAEPEPCTKTGRYMLDISGGAYAPCPTCIRSCSEGGSGFACTYSYYLPPAACTKEMIGEFILDAEGSEAVTWKLTLPGGVGDWHGTPYINWQANPTEPIAYSENSVTFTNHNFTIEMYDYDATHSVVKYAPGCALLYRKI